MVDSRSLSSAAALRLAGRRGPTRQRVVLAELPSTGPHQHVRAEKVRGRLTQAEIGVSRAILHNALNQYPESGVLGVLTVDASYAYFGTDTCDHHHLFPQHQCALKRHKSRRPARAARIHLDQPTDLIIRMAKTRRSQDVANIRMAKRRGRKSLLYPGHLCQCQARRPVLAAPRLHPICSFYERPILKGPLGSFEKEGIDAAYCVFDHDASVVSAWSNLCVCGMSSLSRTAQARSRASWASSGGFGMRPWCHAAVIND
ncbi:transcriptional repressor [Mesorhizobium prunaredense]